MARADVDALFDFEYIRYSNTDYLIHMQLVQCSLAWDESLFLRFSGLTSSIYFSPLVEDRESVVKALLKFLRFIAALSSVDSTWLDDVLELCATTVTSIS